MPFCFSAHFAPARRGPVTGRPQRNRRRNRAARSARRVNR